MQPAPVVGQRLAFRGRVTAARRSPPAGREARPVAIILCSTFGVQPLILLMSIPQSHNILLSIFGVFPPAVILLSTFGVCPPTAEVTLSLVLQPFFYYNLFVSI